MAGHKSPPLVLSLVVVLAALSLITLGAYWWYTYSGLYRWLAELQIQLIGAYYPTYTGIFTIVLLFLPFVGLTVLVHKAFGFEPLDSVESAPPGQADAWLRQNSLSLGLFVMGVVFVGIGLYNLVAGWTAGKRTPVALAELEAGALPPTRWVLLDGTLVHDRALMQGEQHGGRDEKGRPLGTYFIPVVAHGRDPAQATVFLKIHTRRLDELKMPLEGTLVPSGLPGPIRVAFEERGPRPTVPHYVLHFMLLPSENINTGWLIGGIGAGLVLLAVIIWIVKAVRTS